MNIHKILLICISSITSISYSLNTNDFEDLNKKLVELMADKVGGPIVENPLKFFKDHFSSARGQWIYLYANIQPYKIKSLWMGNQLNELRTVLTNGYDYLRNTFPYSWYQKNFSGKITLAEAEKRAAEEAIEKAPRNFKIFYQQMCNLYRSSIIELGGVPPAQIPAETSALGEATTWAPAYDAWITKFEELESDIHKLYAGCPSPEPTLVDTLKLDEILHYLKNRNDFELLAALKAGHSFLISSSVDPESTRSARRAPEEGMIGWRRNLRKVALWDIEPAPLILKASNLYESAINELESTFAGTAPTSAAPYFPGAGFAAEDEAAKDLCLAKYSK